MGKDDKRILDSAKRVLDIEIDGLKAVKDKLGTEFVGLVSLCLEVLNGGGKLVMSGVGKSGHIASKIAATLASTGSTAVFMHPVEALHGDLGILATGDILLACSYSGETDELLAILPSAKRLGTKIVALTGAADSRLARWCDLAVPMNVPKEACPFNLAPTATTTALLAVGDALAMTLLAERGFSKEDYGRLHPGGAIGRAVTLRIADIMRPLESLATAAAADSVKDTLFRMTARRCGSAVVVGDGGEPLGIFTDGDLRRHVEVDIGVLERPIGEVMTRGPASLNAEDLAVEALKLVEQRKIDDIIVIDKDGRVVGMVDIQDLPGLKLM